MNTEHPPQHENHPKREPASPTAADHSQFDVPGDDVPGRLSAAPVTGSPRLSAAKQRLATVIANGEEHRGSNGVSNAWFRQWFDEEANLLKQVFAPGKIVLPKNPNDPDDVQAKYAACLDVLKKAEKSMNENWLNPLFKA